MYEPNNLIDDDVFYTTPLWYDGIFRGLIGREDTIDILKDLVNSVLRQAGLAPVEKLTLRNPFQLANWRDQKETILDLLGEDADKRKINLEMQSSKIAYMEQRSLFYPSRAYSDQLGPNQSYSDLKPCYSIWLCRFPLPNQPKTRWFDKRQITSAYDPTVTMDDLTLLYVRLPKQPGEMPDNAIIPPLSDWVKTVVGVDVTPREEVEEIVRRNPTIGKLKKITTRFMSTEEARMYIDAERLREADQIAREECAKEEGKAEGKAEGMAEGRAEGMAEGKAKGIEEKGLEDRLGIINQIFNLISSRFPYEAGRVNGMREKLTNRTHDELLRYLITISSCAKFSDFASIL